jgi:hypothetical protein
MLAGTFVRSFRATRAENWWFSKIPPLLAVAYLEVARNSSESGHLGVLVGCFLCSISSVAAYGHIINDAFDVETDLRAGKPNRLFDTSWTERMLLCATFVLAGFGPALIAQYSARTLLILVLNFLWPTIYSLPVVRLKERGVAGLVCDALGSHVTPTLLALSLFEPAFPSPSSAFFPVVMTTWAAVLGIKGILHHQIIDRANDIRSGTVTFATNAIPERMSSFLTFFNLFAELPVSTALAVATWGWAPLVAVAFAAYCVLETVKYWLGFQFALTSEAWTVRRSVPFANESLYVLWLPVAAAIQLVATDPVWIWIPIGHVLLFYPNVAAQVTELKAVIRLARLRNPRIPRVR